MYKSASKSTKNIIERLVVVLLIISILFGSTHIPIIFGEGVATASTPILINTPRGGTTPSDIDNADEIELISGEEHISGDFKYIVKDGKVVITGLVDSFTGTSISIPDTIGTMPVEEIKDRAFYIKGVETLTLGNNIKKIV